ncbi:adenylate cyclase CyaB [Lepeophtheirus salmonis]|uniref:adenylate cyclase CyaB n=1 Tax=Lepeophtheirus salmonis TaxID=72036 RepID=UPI00077F220D|nr:uncharacterized protein LOC121131786 [Lepeophtheirus salmonis]
MKINIEIKARLPTTDLAAFRAKVEALGPDGPVSIIKQEDTFFNAPNARLKLRVIDEKESQLISYKRSDQYGPKGSVYEKVPVIEPQSLKRALEMSHGIKGTVSKTRYLYVIGQTRVHCDAVKGLGDFMELEVVLNEGQSLEEGDVIAKKLMKDLEIKDEHLVKGAYLDLLILKS